MTNPEAWFEAEAEVVRNAADRGLAVLGSCFAHQMLAWALSGPECAEQRLRDSVGWRSKSSTPILSSTLFPTLGMRLPRTSTRSSLLLIPGVSWRPTIAAPYRRCVRESPGVGDAAMSRDISR